MTIRKRNFYAVLVAINLLSTTSSTFLKEPINIRQIFRPLNSLHSEKVFKPFKSTQEIRENTSFKTKISDLVNYFPLQTDGKFNIKVEVKNRGSLEIIVFLFIGSNSMFEILESRTVSFDAVDYDRAASEGMENIFLLTKNFSKNSNLAIILLQPFNRDIESTEVHISTIDSSNSCPFECKTGGKCIEGKCVCQKNYLGRVCDKVVLKKTDISLDKEFVLEERESLHFYEEITSGNTEVTVFIEDETKPFIGIFFNQFDHYEDKLFMTRSARGLKNDTYMDILGDLRNLGKGEIVFKTFKEYVFFTFVNYDSATARFRLKIERKTSTSSGTEIDGITTGLVSILTFLLFSCLVFCIKGKFAIRALSRTRRQTTPTEREESISESDYESSNHEIPQTNRPLVTRRNRVSNSVIEVLNKGEIDKYFPEINILQDSKNRSARCSICENELGNGLPVREIEACGDFFHSKCLMDWFDKNNSCPNCKFLICKTNLENKMKKKLKKAEVEVEIIPKKKECSLKDVKFIQTPSRRKVKLGRSSNDSKSCKSKLSRSSFWKKSKMDKGKSSRNSRKVKVKVTKWKGKKKENLDLRHRHQSNDNSLRVKSSINLREVQQNSINMVKSSNLSHFDSIPSIENSSYNSRLTPNRTNLRPRNSDSIIKRKNQKFKRKPKSKHSKRSRMRKKNRLKKGNALEMKIRSQSNNTVKNKFIRPDVNICHSVGRFGKSKGFHFQTEEDEEKRNREMNENIEKIIFKKNKGSENNFGGNNELAPIAVSKSKRGDESFVSERHSQKSQFDSVCDSSFLGSIHSRNTPMRKSIFGKSFHEQNEKKGNNLLDLKRKFINKKSRFHLTDTFGDIRPKSCMENDGEGNSDSGPESYLI